MPYSAAFGHGEPAPRTDRGYVWKLSLGALGVVYGDIGTSPLYAMRECFHGAHALPITPNNVLGVLSLMFWSLMLIVTLKYLVYVLRADNKGEGGILALMALAMSKLKTRALRPVVVALRNLRRRAALRRRRHHAGHHGLERHRGSFHRGARDLHASSSASSRSLILVGLVRDPKARDRGHRHHLRADHGGVVPACSRLLGVLHVGDESERAAQRAPDVRRAFFLANGVHGTIVLGSCLPRRDRRRGALRGPRALRQASRSDGRGSAWCCPRSF